MTSDKSKRYAIFLNSIILSSCFGCLLLSILSIIASAIRRYPTAATGNKKIY